MFIRSQILVLGLTLATTLPAMAGQMGLTLPKPLNWISGYSQTAAGVRKTTAQEMSNRLNLQNDDGEISMTFDTDYTMGAIWDINFGSATVPAMNFIELLSAGEVSAVRIHHHRLDYRDLCFTLEGEQLFTKVPYKRNISGKSLEHPDKIKIVGPDECSLSF